jgi:hypothetical protein
MWVQSLTPQLTTHLCLRSKVAMSMFVPCLYLIWLPWMATLHIIWRLRKEWYYTQIMQRASFTFRISCLCETAVCHADVSCSISTSAFPPLIPVLSPSLLCTLPYTSHSYCNHTHFPHCNFVVTLFWDCLSLPCCQSLHCLSIPCCYTARRSPFLALVLTLSVVTLLFCCYTVVTLVSYCCWALVTLSFDNLLWHCLSLPCCYTRGTLISHCRYPAVTLSFTRTHTHTHTHTHKKYT